MPTASPPQPVIGEIVRVLRHKTGKTQEELAGEVGVHTTEISRLENGLRNPKWGTMKRLAKGLGVPCWHMVALAEVLDMERGEAT